MVASNLLKQIQQNHQYASDLRRYFHQHPELGRNEFSTASKIEDELDKLGISHKRVDGTGVYAEIVGNKDGNKAILLRADIDALPISEESEVEYKSLNQNTMHACGHDVHTTSLLMAAKYLKQNQHLFAGKVILHFQHAEEIGYGAKQFINQGYCQQASRCLGIHVTPKLKAGHVGIIKGVRQASVDWFKIIVTGKAAHISTPSEGIDALSIACNIVTSLHKLSVNAADSIANVLIGIGKINAGTSYNIIAQNAQIEGTVRMFSNSRRSEIKQKIIEIAQQEAKKSKATVEVLWQEYGSAVVNDDFAVNELTALSQQVFGKENVITNLEPTLAGDDFAEYLLSISGVYAHIGISNANDPHTCLPLHSNCFDVDEQCLDIATALFVAQALDYLK